MTTRRAVTPKWLRISSSVAVWTPGGRSPCSLKAGQVFIRLSTSLNPPHRLLRQLVERGHAEFEVFFLCVLDFIVADAVQTLDEHHHGRHAGARDFGGVVQRAARQAMRLAAGFADGFVAQGDEFVVE